MNIRNPIFITLWPAVVFSTNLIAKDIDVYRWVDENNVVHFSQQLPTNKNYTQLTTVSSFQAQKRVSSKSSNGTSVDDKMTKFEKEKAEAFAKNAEIAEKNCKTAQLNEKTLNAFDSVMFTDSDGKNRALSDEEKKAKLALSKEHIDMFCKKESDN